MSDDARVIEHRACYIDTPKYKRYPKQDFDSYEIERVLESWGVEPLPVSLIHDMLTAYKNELERPICRGGEQCAECGVTPTHTPTCPVHLAYLERFRALMNKP